MHTITNLGFGLLVSVASVTTVPATAQPQRSNIILIMADDISVRNISAYTHGMMGYHTPNIDRIANEGDIFKDYYGQQSCTASMLFNLRSDLFERTSFNREAKG